ILLCINTGEKQSTPSAKDFDDEEGKPKGTRFAFANDEFFFKTKAQMQQKFSDLPQALDNTQLIVDKVDVLKLKQDIMLPNYEIPAGFADQDEFLQHMTYQGAIKRYLGDPSGSASTPLGVRTDLTSRAESRDGLDTGLTGGIDSLPPHIKERLDFELFTIRTMGFAGYFLI